MLVNIRLVFIYLSIRNSALFPYLTNTTALCLKRCHSEAAASLGTPNARTLRFGGRLPSVPRPSPSRKWAFRRFKSDFRSRCALWLTIFPRRELKGSEAVIKTAERALKRLSDRARRSVAKSFTSALVGIAIQDGFIKSVGDPITDYLPELKGQKGFDLITIKNLLTMGSGIRYRLHDFPWDEEPIAYFYPDLTKLMLSGYGNTIEAMAGVTGLTGYHDGGGQRYTLSNALGDPVGGLHGVFALMVAMRERERTGRGQLIELAQVEALIPFVADAILEYQFTGKAPPARGNRHRAHAPHGIYRCAGDDNWIALACDTDDQWRSLAGALGMERIAADPRFAGASARKVNEDALDAELSRAIAQLNADDCLARIRDAGVLAAPVNPAPAVMADPQIQSRDYFVAIDRAVVGTHLYPGAVARIPDNPLRADVPAPMLGEHNRQVFAEMLGMTDGEIAELERIGVIGSSPRQYRSAS